MPENTPHPPASPAAHSPLMKHLLSVIIYIAPLVVRPADGAMSAWRISYHMRRNARKGRGIKYNDNRFMYKTGRSGDVPPLPEARRDI